MTIQERESMWENRIASYKSSGQTKKAWCNENNIDVKGFYRWGCRLARKQSDDTDEPSRRFVLAKEGAVVNNTSSVMIHIGKATVSISKGYDTETLKNVLGILNVLC